MGIRTRHITNQNITKTSSVLLYAVKESERQHTDAGGPKRMVEAWEYLKDLDELYLDDVVALGTILEPQNNGKFRSVPVTFNQESKPALAPELVERQIILWFNNVFISEDYNIDEKMKMFLDIHPFLDGNGRVASLLYNYLNKSLDQPLPLPYYYGNE